MDDDVISERFQRVWDHFAALEKLAEERIAAQGTALLKAEQSLADYKLTSNEFRGAMSDLAGRLLPRAEYSTQHATLTDKLNSLETRVLQNTALQSGRDSGISKIGYVVVSVIGVCVGIASVASILITLLHTPNPSTETQSKLDALSNQINTHLKK